MSNLVNRAAGMTLNMNVSAIGEDESLFLDLVRLLSAQMVFFGHLFSFLYGSEYLIGGRVQIQNLGVVVFFILSGYLICRTMRKYEDFKGFFVDRFARIYVTLVPCLALIVGMDYLIRGTGAYIYQGAYNVKTLIGNVLMLQDHPVFLAARRLLDQSEPFVTSFGSARPLWTLAVEWWLYMFIGYICLAKRRNIPVLIGLSVVPVVFATIGRGEGLTLFWMFGAAMIFLPPLEVSRRQLLLLSAGLLCLYVGRFATSQDFFDTQANVFLAAMFCSLLLWSRRTVVFSTLPRVVKRAIRILAGASYAYYILHYTVIELIRLSDIERSWVGPSAFVLANALAILVYFMFDRHHKRFGLFLRTLLFKPHRVSHA